MTPVPVTAPDFNQSPPDTAPVTPAQGTSTPQGANLIPSQAANIGQQGLNQQAQAKALQAQMSIPVAQLQQQQAQAAAARYDQAKQQVNAADANLAGYINQNPINRSRIFDQMGTGQRIATAIGLAFGGFSNGLTGHGNPAMDWLMDQQQKDINAQIQNTSNQKTLWDAAHQLFGDNNAATEFVKGAWNRQVSAMGNEITATLGTINAAAGNKLLQADLLNKYFQNMHNAAWYTATKGSGARGAQQQSPNQTQNQKSVEGVTTSSEPKYGVKNADEQGLYTLMPLATQDVYAKLADLETRAHGGNGLDPDPRAAADLPFVLQQLSDAKNRDYMMSQMPRLMQTLIENRTAGGWAERNVGGNESTAAGLAALPVVGKVGAGIVGGLASKAGDIVNAFTPGTSDENTSFRMEENYKNAVNQISDYITKLYPTASDASRASKLSSVIADLKSNPDNIKKHLKAFEDLAKTGGRWDALERNGMLREGTLE